jgi:hypothetical protein
MRKLDIDIAGVLQVFSPASSGVDMAQESHVPQTWSKVAMSAGIRKLPQLLAGKKIAKWRLLHILAP